MNDLAARGQFRHEALLYPDADVYVEATTTFVRAGLASGEPVLLAVPAANLDLIRRALGRQADEVRFVDMAQAGRNPNRIIPWILRAFLAEHEPCRARIIGESIWPERAPEEVPLAIQHEALINKSFVDRDATILCPYDSTRLSPSLLSFAARTHPIMWDGHEARPCAAYTDPDVVVTFLNEPLPDESVADAELVFDVPQLREMRQLVHYHATRVGLPADRVADLQLAVNEVATNTLVHGQGPGLLKIRYGSDRLICEIQGPGEIANWLAGRIIPPEDSPRGRGLLVANRLCDLVETYTHPTSTTTRLHMRL
jgi:anti-sigma regulatory factor (Ser/Thr protein kinase)